MLMRQEIHQLIDALPESTLMDLRRWLRNQRVKPAVLVDEQSGQIQPRYTPVRLAGLWHGITIDDDEIHAVRQTMWAGFGESPQ